MSKNKNLKKAAMMANMDPKTARKYLKSDKLPGQIKKERERNWRTRQNPFDDVWLEVRRLLEINPGLQAKKIFVHLQKLNPGKFPDYQLRTFQRHIKVYRATEGPAKEVFSIKPT